MSDLVITGVFDGPLTGGIPKAIQVHAPSDISDLSEYGLGSANNDGGSDGEEFTFPAVAVAAGTTLYVATEDTAFAEYFGFAPDYTSFAASINGDDSIELFRNGAVVDVFGEVGVDGSGTAWEYTDGWAWRDPATAVPSPVFDVSDWVFSGPDALDGAATNDGSSAPFPPDAGTGVGGDIVVNELRISSSGASDDTSNFVELLVEPGTSLDGKALLVLSGEFAPGVVDFAIDLSGAVADAEGFLLVTNSDNPELEAGDIGVDGLDFFGSPQSFLVVDGFTGAEGDDLDADDDGVFDATPWTAVLDGVSLTDGDATQDINYADTVIPPDGDFPAAGVARETDGTGAFVALPFGDQSGDTPGESNEAATGPERVTIMEIQGAGHVSALVSGTPQDPTTGGAGPRVITSGIVTAIDSNGFYLQDATGDGDIATSDAIFVFTGTAPTVMIGDAVDVEGTVSEFYPGGQGTGNLSTTQLGGGVDITVLSSGNDLPEAVILGEGGRPLPAQTIEDDGFTSFDPETDGIDFFEALEGMLVTAPQPVAVSGTTRFGEIFVTVDGGAGATGLSDRGTLNISPDDFNPEKVQIDADFGLDLPDVNVGATFEDITGVISYDFGNYQINPTEQVVVVEPSPLAAEVTELAGSENQLTVASYNVLNLDPVVEVQENTNNGEARNVDDDIGNGRFAAIAEQIVTNLGTPDIIALQEIQDNTGGEIDDGVISASLTFETLINAIDLADDGVMNGSSGYAYIDNTFITDQASGGQPGGNIRTGFLYREDRVSLVEGSVQTIGGQGPGAAFEGARLPLVADFEFNGEEVTVISNHFSSKGGSAPILGVEQDFAARQEDVTVNGSLDERQRQSEAVNEFVAGLIAADPEANVVVAGDFNEFEFVSPVEALEQNLVNLTNTIAEDERYSFIFQGNSQSLDHILVSDNLAGTAEFDIVHVNSEFAETPARASDHDPLLALLTIGEVAPETIEVAVDFARARFLGTKAIESVDGQVKDVERTPLFDDEIVFDDAGVTVTAENPGGWEFLSFARGTLGVISRGEIPFTGPARLLDGEETFVFDLDEGPLGDATGVSFDFARVRGDGEVSLAFFDDGVLVDEMDFVVTDKQIVADLDDLSFDRVVMSVGEQSRVSLDGFAFDRIVEDDPFLV